MFFQTKHKRYNNLFEERISTLITRWNLPKKKKLLPIGFEPMISTLLVWRLTNLAIEARTCWFSTLHQAILFI